MENICLFLKEEDKYCDMFGHKKSRIRETKHLSTDADSSTDTTVGWTKNTAKPILFEKRKKSSKTQKSQKRLEICQNLRYTLRPEVSNPSGRVHSGFGPNLDQFWSTQNVKCFPSKWFLCLT